jgi:hypothetical protein
MWHVASRPKRKHNFGVFRSVKYFWPADKYNISKTVNQHNTAINGLIRRKRLSLRNSICALHHYHTFGSKSEFYSPSLPSLRLRISVITVGPTELSLLRIYSHRWAPARDARRSFRPNIKNHHHEPSTIRRNCQFLNSLSICTWSIQLLFRSLVCRIVYQLQCLRWYCTLVRILHIHCSQFFGGSPIAEIILGKFNFSVFRRRFSQNGWTSQWKPSSTPMLIRTLRTLRGT